MSRQMSSTLLSDMPLDDKHKKLRSQASVEASRRLQKYAGSPRLATSIYAIFSLSAKSDRMGKCEIDPGLFVDRIKKDEARTDHSGHTRKSTGDAVDLENVDYLDISAALRVRWRKSSGFFIEAFWDYIAQATFTTADNGVYSFNQVEVVEKDREKLKGPRG